ncbi:MAG: SRPBCC family protein [Thermoanaerobaculia bacterium]
MNLLRRSVLVFLALFASSIAEAATPLPEVSIEDPVAVALDEAPDGSIEVEGRFAVAATQATAWRVLTDYEHMPEFISAMRVSHVRSRIEHQVTVEQESVGRLLFVSRTVRVVLDVHEVPDVEIRFEDTAHGSFESYRGSWTLENSPDATRIVYRLTARTKTSVPAFLLRNAYRRMVRELLEELRVRVSEEARRESNSAAPSRSPSPAAPSPQR